MNTPLALETTTGPNLTDLNGVLERGSSNDIDSDDLDEDMRLSDTRITSQIASVGEDFVRF